MAGTYETLHRECRTLESLFDTKLTAYSRLASTISKPSHDPADLEAGTSNERWKDLEFEVDDLLEKLEETNEQLGVLSDNADTAPSQAMQRAIQRHRDVFQEYARELRRTKANVKHALDQANLLSGVRNDIDAYHSNAADTLLSERGHIDDSHRMTDDMLEQAYETRAEFARQRSSLAGINTRMAGVMSQMPSINDVISMIKSRRRRDTIIVGSLIGSLAVFLIWYTFF